MATKAHKLAKVLLQPKNIAFTEQLVDGLIEKAITAKEKDRLRDLFEIQAAVAEVKESGEKPEDVEA